MICYTDFHVTLECLIRWIFRFRSFCIFIIENMYLSAPYQALAELWDNKTIGDPYSFFVGSPASKVEKTKLLPGLPESWALEDRIFCRYFNPALANIHIYRYVYNTYEHIRFSNYA